jgi:hypothetical protein
MNATPRSGERAQLQKDLAGTCRDAIEGAASVQYIGRTLELE